MSAPHPAELEVAPKMTQRTDQQPSTTNEEHGPRAGVARSWYEVLELSRDATVEEVEAAYDRAISLIEGRSIAGYLMLDPDSMEAVRHDVETAYLILSDAQARAEFDAELDRREQANESANEGVEARAERDTEIPRDVTLEDQPPEPAERDTEVPREVSREDENTDDSDDDREERASQPPARRKLALRILAPVEEPVETPAKIAAERSSTPPRASKERTSNQHAAKERVAHESIATVRAVKVCDESEPPTSRGPKLRFASRSVVEEVSDPRPVRTEEPPPEEESPLPPDGEINGQVLRRVREARGMSIAELSEATKISKSYLIAMEEQDLDDLPARVYLRGFLTQVARVLKVDRTRLAEGYLAFVERYRR